MVTMVTNDYYGYYKNATNGYYGYADGYYDDFVLWDGDPFLSESRRESHGKDSCLPSPPKK